MSMNPARTFNSALGASYWHAIWIYFIALALGMFCAAEVFLQVRGGAAPYCAKLHHANNKRCIFQHPQQDERSLAVEAGMPRSLSEAFIFPNARKRKGAKKNCFIRTDNYRVRVLKKLAETLDLPKLNF